MPDRPVPRYQEIADHLRDQISDGTIPAGQPLPSEERLAEQFGVSRPTVRRGIAELQMSGLVDVQAGRGMFVRHPTEQTPDGARLAAVEAELARLRARVQELENRLDRN